MKTNWVENFFHEKENPENLICLMIGYKKCTRTFLGSLYNQSWNTYFMKYSEINISQCILALLNTSDSSHLTKLM